MASIEGSLSKWTNVMKGWQFRWFVLDDNAGLLSYYTSKEKMMRGVRRGCVRLKGAVIGIDDEDDSTFTITVDGKTFHFQAKDADEREKWIRGLEDTILRHAHRMRWDPSRPTPSIQDFDKKLSEADAYLQIIIDQVKALDLRLLNMTDIADRTRCEIIRDHANDMLEAIKHSIVLLQIAKNTAHPVNGIYQGSTSYSTEVSRQGSIKGSPSPTGIESNIVGAHVTGSGGHRSSMTLIVPETSYSSSEEEDFYDANEFNETPSSTTSHGHRSFADAVGHDERDNVASSASAAITSGGLRTHTRTSIIDSRLPLLEDGSIDYDALYDCDDEEMDMGSMESHGNIVTHLLSQVKIGMDLTKVVLPTFILERRSLLEMYADYFAHPDIFVSIADFKDPKDRMVQVVRWYLSAYHAGRRSGVAKKPYNPILGEIFQCYWDVPHSAATPPAPVSTPTPTPMQTQTSTNNASLSSSSSTSSSTPLVPDGPVPWCNRNQLTFISEQVSHHPPISAFYAEHYNNRISFCAHVWTKSKFLGLSIGVHNIGQGCVSLLNYDEEYIVTFPNGYGRSILTVPWIELGGTVTITCAKSGYSATVEFLTKPFYGGKKNRIVAEVFQPSDKKPFLTVSGEWNGAMEAKWADGRTENFIDVNKLSIVKKIVRPISEQDENESRRLWKDVTVGLRFNDIERATRAKYLVEQRQRDLAKERKDSGDKWETKMFQEAGENWIYREPLVQRLSGKVTPLTQNH